MSRRVAYQGEPGAYSDVAVGQYFHDRATGLPCATFAEALQRVIDGSADAAMLPVENAIAGPVHAALEVIEQAGNSLVRLAEHRLVIVLCVLALPGAMLPSVERVRSHPVALAQCRIFLARHPWLEAEPHADTAGAARELAESGDRTSAAIASELAATRYGLEVITRGVQDVPHNWTRFVVLMRHDHPDVQPGRASPNVTADDHASADTDAISAAAIVRPTAAATTRA